MEITISWEDKNLLKLVRKLAEELGLSVVEIPVENKFMNNNAEDLYQLMEEMTNSGAFRSIENPVKWQKDQRKDRSLPGRS